MKKLNVIIVYNKEENKILMCKREKEPYKGKYNLVGGKLEENEDSFNAAYRELKEETGLTLTSYRFRGIVTFITDGLEEAEYMHLYTADGFEGEIIDCDEGTLEWVPKNKIPELNLWEGDLIFFKLLAEDAPFFSLKLVYQGDKLVEAALNGNIF